MKVNALDADPSAVKHDHDASSSIRAQCAERLGRRRGRGGGCAGKRDRRRGAFCFSLRDEQ